MPTNQYDELIRSSAEANGLDPDLFRKQLVQESSLNPDAVSPKGALGIGQIMPQFWKGQHGLNTEADFKDPLKNIPAAAAIMGDLVRKHGGWNQGLVAYNAGPGKKNKNIMAYNSGDLTKLPAETQDYLKKLGVTTEVGPTPGVLLEQNPMTGSSPLGQRQLQSGVVNAWDVPIQGVGQSLAQGVQASTLGTAFRMENPLALVTPNDYQFTPEDLEVIRGAELGEGGTRFVMRNATRQEDIQGLIQVARENRTAASQERSLVGGLAYGVGEMLGDPVTYASMALPVGIYGRAAQLFSGPAAKVVAGTGAVAMEGAVTNMASEGLREGTTGTDADYAGAMAAGALFSVGLLGAAKATGKAYDSITRGLNRVEASQTAEGLSRGGAEAVVDPTRLSVERLDEIVPGWRQQQGNPESAFIKTVDGDYIHPASGTQYSSHNPMNPALADPVDPNLGGRFTAEVGDVVARSEVPEFKQMAWDLIRTTRGYADGSNGKVGITAQDVDSTMRGHHASFQMEWDDLRTQAFADPSYVGSGATLAEKRRVFNERVMRAVEADDFSGLTAVERRAAELRKERYAQLAEAQVTPGAPWGVRAQPLMTRTRDNYQPVVYNEVKLDAMRQSLGPEELQDAVARSFYGSYLRDAEVKTRTDAYLQSIGATFDAEEYARRVAFGIVNQGEGINVGRLNLMMDAQNFHMDNLPDFRQMRSPFGYDHDVPLKGGGRFSVNDLRSWDADLIDSAYFNRVKGDVSVLVGTGRTPEQFKEWLSQARDSAERDANLKGEVLAFEKIAGNLYGQGIRGGGERLNAVAGVFQDLAFMKSSAFMGLLNYGEIAGGIVKHGMGFAMRGVPGLGKFFQDARYGRNSANTLRTAQNVVWGSALDRAILPTYRDAIDNNVRRLWADSGVNRMNTVLGTIKGATGAASARFWTSRVLNSTNKQIIEAARTDFFADLAGLAHGARESSFGKPARFKEASLNAQQMDDALALLRETTRIEPDGTMTITDAAKLGNDPRVSHLRRYGQYWSERVIQQNAIGSTFRWSHLPMVGMFTQFMSFVTRSVNSKLIRGNSDIFRNGNVDEFLSLYVVGAMLGGLQYAGVTYLQSLKQPTEERKEKFLEERFGDKEDFGPIAAGALKRMPVMSGASWLYDTIGTTRAGQAVAPEVFKYAGFGKTSTEAKLRQDAQQGTGPVGGYLGDAVENAPAVKLLDSFLGATTGAASQALAQDWTEREKATKATYRALSGLVPNDPISQRAFQELMMFTDTN